MRGEVFRFVPRASHGHEQQGPRYAIVVQADRLLHLSSWLVVPTSTTERAAPAPFRPVVEVEGRPTRAMCEHLRGIDTRQLKESAGFCTRAELEAVDEGLRLVLDLPGRLF